MYDINDITVSKLVATAAAYARALTDLPVFICVSSASSADQCILGSPYLTSNLIRVLHPIKKVALIAVIDKYIIHYTHILYTYHHEVAATIMLKFVAHLNQGLLPVTAQ